MLQLYNDTTIKIYLKYSFEQWNICILYMSSISSMCSMNGEACWYELWLGLDCEHWKRIQILSPGSKIIIFWYTGGRTLQTNKYKYFRFFFNICSTNINLLVKTIYEEELNTSLGRASKKTRLFMGHVPHQGGVRIPLR